MGRKKIKIQTIENDRQKNVTFARRRGGLIKKAHELAVLCESKVALLMFDAKDACHVYSSEEDHEDLIRKYYHKEFRTITGRRQKSAKGSYGTDAVVNQYHITSNGDGSENLHVKQVRNAHNSSSTSTLVQQSSPTESSEITYFSSEPTSPIETSAYSYPHQFSHMPTNCQGDIFFDMPKRQSLDFFQPANIMDFPVSEISSPVDIDFNLPLVSSRSALDHVINNDRLYSGPDPSELSSILSFGMGPGYTF
ncbi:hypothetical protein K7432_012938 [Basidiobolus ranarum]|uniref:MADS-box domain-containing protein n=1 Tax=Basidiobolus ranarum TaxID=34480 RepID=A0ABR2VRH6_9FUNG